MNDGWIKIHRKMLDWEWYTDSCTKDLFLHLLLIANHKEKMWKGNIIKRGEVLTGRIKLAEELGLGIQKIRTSLNRLKSTSEITIKTTNKYSLIKLKNYEEYQESNQLANQQLTINQPATNHKQERKKEKNINIPFNFFWNSYNKKVDKSKCEKKWNSLTEEDRKKAMHNIPLYIKNTPDVKYRKNPITWLNGKCWEDEVLENIEQHNFY